jgi:hypothetical protein
VKSSHDWNLDERIAVNRRSWAAALLLPLLAACAQKYPQVPYIPIAQATYESTETWPATGVLSSAEIGASLHKTFNGAKLPGVELKSAFSTTVPYRDNVRMGIDVAPGKLELAATDGAGGKYYRAMPNMMLSWRNTSGESSASQRASIGGVHVTEQGRTSVFWLWGREGPANHVAAPELVLQPTTVTRLGQKAFQRELVYSGISGSSVSLLYREFGNDPLRPTFSQELKYDLASSRTIGFKGTRIEVVEANNTAIRYRVLSPLE